MAQTKSSKEGKKNRIWLNFIYLAAVVGILFYLLMQEDNLTSVASAMRGLSRTWLAVAAVCSVGFLMVEGGAMFFTIRWLCPQSHIGYFASLKTALIGQFYSAITPSATGGQPMQVIDLYQDGLSVGHGTSVVMIRFVTHQTAIFLFTLAGFVSQYSFIRTAMPSLIPLGLLGIAISLGCIALVVGATVSRRMTHAFFDRLTRLLTRLGLCRDPEKFQNQMQDVLEDFHQAGGYLRGHKGQMLVLTGFDIVFFILMFSVTFCLYRAFGLTQYSFIKIILLQAFMHSTVYFFPLPGASGASEGGFLLLFRQVFTAPLVFSSMLLWRLLTYYNKIIIGAGAILWGTLAKTFAKRRERIK
jgi:uncharacterized protein (TIRG00374 family)